MRRPVVISAPPAAPQVAPSRPTIVSAQPSYASQPMLDSQTQPARGWPQPTLAPPQPNDAGQQMMAMAQVSGPAMRYPQHAPIDADNGAVPPSPDRLNELPAVNGGMRPLPPVQ